MLPYLSKLATGALVTLEISVLTVVISTILGLGGAVARTSRQPLLRSIVGTYVEVMRNIPMLVLMYFIYFGLPRMGVRLEPFLCALTALCLNATAYMIEIFRGGLNAIPKGQFEAGFSLSMRPVQVYRDVVFPQLVRIVFPSLGNQVVGIILGSSVASVVTTKEITYVSLGIGANTYRYFEVFTVAALLYVAAVQLINAGWRSLGARWFGVRAR